MSQGKDKSKPAVVTTSKHKRTTLPNRHDNDGDDSKGSRVQWNDERTERLIEWLENNPEDRQKLFSDSSQDAKEDNRRRRVAKGPKSAFHSKMANYIFSADEDPNVRHEVKDDIKKYTKAVENRIMHLKRKYREINTELGRTGAGLTVEELRANPDLNNLLEGLISKFPFWERLHGLWSTLPNFNPYTVSSEPGQDLENEARSVLFPAGPEIDDGDDVGLGLEEIGDSGGYEEIRGREPEDEISGDEDDTSIQQPSHNKSARNWVPNPISATHPHMSSRSSSVTRSLASKDSAPKSSTSNKRNRNPSIVESSIKEQTQFLNDIMSFKTANLSAKRQKMELKSQQERDLQRFTAEKDILIIQERIRDKEFTHQQQIIGRQIELAQINLEIQKAASITSAAPTPLAAPAATTQPTPVLPAHSFPRQLEAEHTQFYGPTTSSHDNYYLTGPSGMAHSSASDCWGSGPLPSLT